MCGSPSRGQARAEARAGLEMGTEPSGQAIQGSRYLEQRIEGQGTGSWWASPLGLNDSLYSEATSTRGG